MAGVGNGWFERRSTKMRTDEYPFIDVRKLEFKSGLDGYVVFAGNALAELEWSSCHFGGHRPYFQCPRCRRRCCILYRYQTEGKSGDSYGCQKCLGMVHPVENEGKLERAMRRSNKVLKRQRYDTTRLKGKPLWMRWPTWKRLSDEVKAAVIVRMEYHEKIVRLLGHLDQK